MLRTVLSHCEGSGQGDEFMTYTCPYCGSNAPKSLNVALVMQKGKPGMCVECEVSDRPNIEDAPVVLGQHMRPAETVGGISIE